MSSFRNLLVALVAIEILGAALLCGWRLNSTVPSPPQIEPYTDAITGAELLALPNTFLFDGVTKWQVLGEAYMVTGFFSRAEACFRQAAECDPSSAEIPMSHGFCLERLGLLDEARNVYHRAATQGSPEIGVRAWYALGRIYLQLEMAAEAREAFEAAGEYHIPSVYQRARLLVRDHHAPEAQPLLKQLADAHPDDLNILQLQAQAAEECGQLEAAADFRDAGERAAVVVDLTDNPPQHLVDDRAFGFTGEFRRLTQPQPAQEQAIAAEKLLNLTRPEVRWRNAMTRYILEDAAKFSLDAGKPALARKLLEQKIFTDKTPSARAWGLLGEVEFAENHVKEAWEDWDHSERVLPGEVDHDKLAKFAAQGGDQAASKRQSALAREAAGIKAYRSNTLPEARTQLRKAVAIDPGRADAWFYLGECERLVAERSRAIEAYKECLKLNRDHGRALARLARLEEPPP